MIFWSHTKQSALHLPAAVVKYVLQEPETGTPRKKRYISFLSAAEMLPHCLFSNDKKSQAWMLHNLATHSLLLMDLIITE